MDRSILRTGIPAAIVASVLGFSLLFPAAASKANGRGDDNHGYGHKCGYGQVDDNDDNDDQGDGGGNAKTTVQNARLAAVPQSVKEKEKHDKDCDEDENDDDDGNGGGGGDRSVSQNQAAAAGNAALGRQTVIHGSRLA